MHHVGRTLQYARSAEQWSAPKKVKIGGIILNANITQLKFYLSPRFRLVSIKKLDTIWPVTIFNQIPKILPLIGRNEREIQVSKYFHNKTFFRCNMHHILEGA